MPNPVNLAHQTRGHGKSSSYNEIECGRRGRVGESEREWMDGVGVGKWDWINKKASNWNIVILLECWCCCLYTFNLKLQPCHVNFSFWWIHYANLHTHTHQRTIFPHRRWLYRAIGIPAQRYIHHAMVFYAPNALLFNAQSTVPMAVPHQQATPPKIKYKLLWKSLFK